MNTKTKKCIVLYAKTVIICCLLVISFHAQAKHQHALKKRKVNKVTSYYNLHKKEILELDSLAKYLRAKDGKIAYIFFHKVGNATEGYCLDTWVHFHNDSNGNDKEPIGRYYNLSDIKAAPHGLPPNTKEDEYFYNLIFGDSGMLRVLELFVDLQQPIAVRVGNVGSFISLYNSGNGLFYYGIGLPLTNEYPFPEQSPESHIKIDSNAYIAKFLYK